MYTSETYDHSHFLISFPQTQILSNLRKHKYILNILIKKKIKCNNKISKLKSPLNNPCYIPSYTLFFDYLGDVLMCPHDWGKKIILGLSDHTPGHATVLGSVALGAKVVEKHFTDDNTRNGPDHKFSMNFQTWKTMVDETRRLEFSMGNGVKKIEFNEKDTNHIQRRSYYSNKNITKGERIKKNFLIILIKIGQPRKKLIKRF